ncbi:Rab5-interacting protein-domain-containing protein [Scheffersomyces coipomensis]|uniref:Rab5-interacting protein-domain-containing protein n=1 Tax=Scheffersomyces coipomensis TaxID=1788519 RepID=UPI00315D4BA6
MSTNDEIIYYPPSIQTNKQKLQRAQDIASLVLGVGCGILTLESAYGFVFYLAGITLTNGIFLTACCEGKPEKFFTKPKQEIFLEGLFNNVPGFVMMWCLIYALVKASS